MRKKLKEMKKAVDEYIENHGGKKPLMIFEDGTEIHL